MPKSDLPPLAQTNYSNKTRRTVHTPIGHSVHNLLTTSVHNLMTLTVHEVLTLYIPGARYRPIPGSWYWSGSSTTHAVPDSD